MGSLQALALNECTKDGTCDLDAALRIHFSSNHYPPLPPCLVRTARTVIRLAKREKWNSQVTLPAGVTWKGQKRAPVHECVQAWHLDAFLEA